MRELARRYEPSATHQSKRACTAQKLGVDLGDCREQNRLTVGVREAFGQLYTAMGWDSLLGARRASSNRILKELVLARITQPRSKRGTVMDLARDSGVTLNLDRVYQSMDFLTDRSVIDQIRQQSSVCAQRLFEQPIDVLFYDTTTLYFESEREDPETKHALRFKGYSKDGKAHRVQVLLALVVTREGIPLDYELYPGNLYEGKTLSMALDSLSSRYNVQNITLVADAGLFSKDNLQWMRERNIPYIVGFRAQSASKALKQQILDANGFQNGNLEKSPRHVNQYKIIQHGNERIIVTYSSRRAAKDRHTRARAVEKLQKRLQKSAQPASLTNRGHARFLDFPKAGKVVINEQKIAQTARWDGIRAIIACGSDDLDAPQLLDHYRQLWHIEHGFRTNKHDLKIRPIYHWTVERIRAHIAICYMAFCCVQHMRHRLKALGQPMSPEVIRRELNHLQISILEHQGNGKKYAMPSCASVAARRIYRCVNLKWNNAPFEIEPMRKRTRTH